MGRIEDPDLAASVGPEPDEIGGSVSPQPDALGHSIDDATLAAELSDPDLGATVGPTPHTIGGTVGPEPDALGSRISGETRQWSILMVLLDDVGIGKLSGYAGHPQHSGRQARTPNLDALIANGLRFDKAWAFPWCGPDRASFLTGRFPGRHGFKGNISLANNYPVPASELTIAHAISNGLGSSIKSRWYCKSHLSVSHPNEPLSNPGEWDKYPVDRWGFGRFWGHTSNLGAENVEPPGFDANHYEWRRVRVTSGSYFYEVVGDNTDPADDAEALSRYATKVVGDFIKTDIPAGSPFFFYFAPTAPHAPHQVPPHSLLDPDTIAGIGYGTPGPDPLPAPSRSESSTDEEDIQFFNAQLEATDTILGEIVAELDAQGKLDETIIVVMSDNGSPIANADEGHPAGHYKGQVYEGGVAAPLVVAHLSEFTAAVKATQTPAVAVAGDFIVDAPRTSNALVNVVDLFPTFLDILRIPLSVAVPDGRAIDGVSFFDVLRDPTAEGKRTFNWVEHALPSGLTGPYIRERFAYRDRRYKYVYQDNDGNGTPESEELFDLDSDPFELTDIMAGSPTPAESAKFSELRAAANALRSSFP